MNFDRIDWYLLLVTFQGNVVCCAGDLVIILSRGKLENV